jgi:hypothetical protein
MAQVVRVPAQKCKACSSNHSAKQTNKNCKYFLFGGEGEVAVLEFKLKALILPRRHCTTWAIPPSKDGKFNVIFCLFVYGARNQT